MHKKEDVLKTLKLRVRKQKNTKNWHNPFDKRLLKLLLKQGQENWTKTKRIQVQVQEKNPEVLVVKHLLILTRKSKKKIKLQEQQLELRKKELELQERHLKITQDQQNHLLTNIMTQNNHF